MALSNCAWAATAGLGLTAASGIFIAITPAIAILRGGQSASLLWLVTKPDNTPNNVMYSWLTGVLSGFLDNVRTYLIFFNTAGGDAGALRPALPITLLAISTGLFLWTQIPISRARQTSW